MKDKRQWCCCCYLKCFDTIVALKVSEFVSALTWRPVKAGRWQNPCKIDENSYFFGSPSKLLLHCFVSPHLNKNLQLLIADQTGFFVHLTDLSCAYTKLFLVGTMEHNTRTLSARNWYRSIWLAHTYVYLKSGYQCFPNSGARERCQPVTFYQLRNVNFNTDHFKDVLTRRAFSLQKITRRIVFQLSLTPRLEG